MINVTEFHLEWDLPLNKDTWTFLESARMAFDTNLRKLVLRAQVCNFKQLLAITSFDHVCELDFHFDYHPNTSTSGGEPNTQLSRIERSDWQAIELDIQDLLETVVPFINHRRISLNSLTISSSSTMDLSKFFKALLLMPALRQFRARIYFDNSCLRDVSGILQLLETHSITLLHVELRPNLPEKADDRNQKLLEKQLNWLRLNEMLLNSHTVLYGLESLEIPYVSPAQTVPLLCRSRDTLTRLYLTDRFLTKDEVTEVVGIFSHRPFEMQHLHVQVKNMDTSLIYMLASRLPGLFSLVLVLDSVPTVSYYNTFIAINLNGFTAWVRFTQRDSRGHPARLETLLSLGIYRATSTFIATHDLCFLHGRIGDHETNLCSCPKRQNTAKGIQNSQMDFGPMTFIRYMYLEDWRWLDKRRENEAV